MKTLDTVLNENRTFAPSQEFARRALVDEAAAQAMYAEAARDPEGFWAAQAQRFLIWRKPFTKNLDRSRHPFVTWFEDGELNITESCLDQHLKTIRRNKAAL